MKVLSLPFKCRVAIITTTPTRNISLFEAEMEHISGICIPHVENNALFVKRKDFIRRQTAFSRLPTQQTLLSAYKTTCMVLPASKSCSEYGAPVNRLISRERAVNTSRPDVPWQSDS